MNHLSFHIIGWVRDRHGAIIHRPLRTYSSAITTFCGSCHVTTDGMGNTTPYVLEVRDK